MLSVEGIRRTHTGARVALRLAALVVMLYAIARGIDWSAFVAYGAGAGGIVRPFTLVRSWGSLALLPLALVLLLAAELLLALLVAAMRRCRDSGPKVRSQ